MKTAIAAVSLILAVAAGVFAWQKTQALDATKADVTFGSQIRSYVFQPYTMVNDHRTELKITDVQKVMDGGIDPFIEAYLKQQGTATVGSSGGKP